jgi:hypothetical protein
LELEIAEIAIHLGINPVSGGIPPNDRRSVGIIKCIIGIFVISLFTLILVDTANF